MMSSLSTKYITIQNDSVGRQRQIWSDCLDAQAGDLHYLIMPQKAPFVMEWLKYNIKIYYMVNKMTY